jgi:hypothetical protein
VIIVPARLLSVAQGDHPFRVNLEFRTSLQIHLNFVWSCGQRAIPEGRPRSSASVPQQFQESNATAAGSIGRQASVLTGRPNAVNYRNKSDPQTAFGACEETGAAADADPGFADRRNPQRSRRDFGSESLDDHQGTTS